MQKREEIQPLNGDMERQIILPGRSRRKSGSGLTRPNFSHVKGDKESPCRELAQTGSEMMDKILMKTGRRHKTYDSTCLALRPLEEKKSHRYIFSDLNLYFIYLSSIFINH